MCDRLQNYDLTGQTAVITGALGLLGPEWAIALLELGARVVLTDRRYSELKRTVDYIREGCSCFSGHLGGSRPTSVGDMPRALDFRIMDVTDADEVQTVVNELDATVLINNAALDPKVTADDKVQNSVRFEDMTMDFFKQSLDVTLCGTVLCCQIFGNKMIKMNRGGVIVNIASELASLAPDQRLYEKPGVEFSKQNVKPVTYMVAKAGVVALTRYLATYPAFLRANIRVNALSPSGVFNGHPEEFVKNLSSRIPIGRMADRDEYRGALQFLASGASTYMNGHNLVMDGGKSVW